MSARRGKRSLRTYSLTFDDVAIVPGYSDMLPSESDISVPLTRNIRLNIPIISAAMDTVTESQMAITMAQNGGMGIIHQYLIPEKQAEEVRRVKRYESWIIEKPVTTNPDESVANIKGLIEQRNVSGIPVIEKNKLIGIITKRDIRFVEDETLKVKDLMTTKLITVGKGINREEAKRILQKNKIEKLLVVNDSGDLEGLITVKDMLKKEQFPSATRDRQGRLMVGAAVGVNDLERVDALCKAGVDVIVVDSAHGHTKNVVNTVKEVKNKYEVDVVAGNIVTDEAAEALSSAGVDAVKVGVGSGSICTTRVVTGVGVPQIAAIERCVEIADKHDVPLISDGGIKQYGDIAKAIAAGASTVMVGNLLAGTEEAPGRKIVLEGRLYKEYRGMGSEGALEKRLGAGRYFPESKKKIVPEGVEGIVDYLGSASDILYDMVGGLKHAMGYAGSKNMNEFRRKAELIVISPGGQREAHPTVRISKEPRNYRRPYMQI